MQGGAPLPRADADGGAPRTAGLVVEHLSFERGGRRVVDDVSFTVGPGRMLAVVGLSGAGKSTLLSLLAGFEAPSSGAIAMAGRAWVCDARLGHGGVGASDVGARVVPTARMVPTAARSIGMSFDDAALHEHLTVWENLDSAAIPRGEPQERRASRVKGLAESLGLAALLARRPATLSAGERRRVAVGRAFIRSPELVLLDEPFANLDRGNRFTVRQMVRELQRATGAIAIVVTHDPTDALAIADDMLVLVDGRVRAHGAAVDVAMRPPDLEVAQLVDDLGMHAIELAGGSALASGGDALASGGAPATSGGAPPTSGGHSGCSLSPAFRARLHARAGDAPVLLGIRPWHVRAARDGGGAAALSIHARVIAHEPAGLFTDVIAVRADGRALRARVAAAEAQELPIGAPACFEVHEEDVHLFRGPWPGQRLA